MWKPARAFTALLALLCAGLAAAPLLMVENQLIVEKDGLKLYPRVNKSLKPIAELEKGQVLTILRGFKAWKQVQVEGRDLKGWIVVDVQRSTTKDGKKFDIVAAPSIAGLVTRGWSKDYAARHGADFSLVTKIMQRSLDPNRYARFLEGEGK